MSYLVDTYWSIQAKNSHLLGQWGGRSSVANEYQALLAGHG